MIKAELHKAISHNYKISERSLAISIQLGSEEYWEGAAFFAWHSLECIIRAAFCLASENPDRIYGHPERVRQFIERGAAWEYMSTEMHDKVRTLSTKMGTIRNESLYGKIYWPEGGIKINVKIVPHETFQRKKPFIRGWQQSLTELLDLYKPILRS